MTWLRRALVLTCAATLHGMVASCTATTCPGTQVMRDGECRLSCNNVSQCSTGEDCSDGACVPSTGGGSSSGVVASGSGASGSGTTFPGSSRPPGSSGTSSVTPSGSSFASGSSVAGASTSGAGLSSSGGGPSSLAASSSGTGSGSSGAVVTSSSAAQQSSSAPPSSSTGAGQPASLSLAGPPSTTAGTCLVLTLAFRDAGDAPVAPPQGTMVQLTGNAAVTFYANSGCTGSGTTALLFPNNATSTTLSARVTRSGPITLTAAALSLTSNLNVTVNAGQGVQLVATPNPLPLRVGRCAAVDVTALDAFGNATGVPTSNVALGPGPTLQLSATADCAMPASSIPLPAAAVGPARFFVLAAHPGDGMVTVNAGGIPPLDITAQVVPGVVHGECTIAANLLTQDCPVPPWVTAEHTVILLSVAPATSRAPEGIPHCALLNPPSMLRCQRNGAAVSITVGYQLFPVPPTVTIHRGSAPCTEPTTTITIPGTTGGFTLMGLLSDGGAFNASDVRAIVPTATGATATGNCTGNVVFHAQQWSWPNEPPADHASNTFPGLVTQATTMFTTPVDVGRTLFNVTWGTTGGSSSACSFTAVSSPGPSTVTTTRASACSAAALSPLVVQRMPLPDSLSLTRLAVDMASGVTEQRFPLVVPREDLAVLAVDTAGGLHGLGANDTAGADLLDISTLLTVTGTELVVTRAGGLGRLQMNLQAITLPPP